MELSKEREINSKELTDPIQINRSRAQSNRQLLESAINKAFKEDKRLDTFVNNLIKEAEERHNITAYQEVLNRFAGKVKEQIDFNVNIRDLRPQQEEIEALNNRFKAIDVPYTIKEDDNKTPPEPFNEEQNPVYIEDTAAMGHNASNGQQGQAEDAVIIETIAADIKPVEKTDTFPGDCQAFQAVDQDMQEHIKARTLDIIEQASEPDIYRSKPHIINRNKSR
jgi:hypothetical protein